MLKVLGSLGEAFDRVWKEITHGSSLKFPLTNGTSCSRLLSVDTLRTSVVDEVDCPAWSQPCPCDRLLLKATTPWRLTTTSGESSTLTVTSALRRRQPCTAWPSPVTRRAWCTAERPDDDVAVGLKTTLSMMRCSARLDLWGLLGSDNTRDELNGDLIRRRWTPGTDARPSARRPAATSVITSAERPSLGVEVMSLTHGSTAERWRRIVAWFTLAMSDDLIDANVLDLFVDWCVVLALMPLLLRLLQQTSQCSS